MVTYFLPRTSTGYLEMQRHCNSATSIMHVRVLELLCSEIVGLSELSIYQVMSPSLLFTCNRICASSYYQTPYHYHDIMTGILAAPPECDAAMEMV